MVFIRLADKYDLNLVSSTREVVYRNRQAASPNSAVASLRANPDYEEPYFCAAFVMMD